MGDIIPWLTPYKKTAPQEDPEDVWRVLAALTRHVDTHRLVLHRVDAWLVPRDGHTVSLTRPAAARQRQANEYPVPLRIGDVLCYNLSFLPVLTHTMVYVGAGFVVHFRPKVALRLFRKRCTEPGHQQEVVVDHIDALTPSQRSRVYVCPENGYTRLSRHRVAMRALATVGTYPDLQRDINCQHIVERILGNESFSIGMPRVAAAMAAFAVGTVTIFLLACGLKEKETRSKS